MSIKLRDQLPLESIDELKAWIEVFDAKARSKDIKDNAQRNALTDAFLGCLSVAQLMKVKQLVAPKTLSEMKWEDIKARLIGFLEPKKRLLIAERTAFMAMKPRANRFQASPRASKSKLWCVSLRSSWSQTHNQLSN